MMVLLLVSFFAIINIEQPNPRHLEEVVFDKDRNKVILFGGVELENGKWHSPSMVHEWDGYNWQRFDMPGPSGRRGHGLVYDEQLKETIVIGGVIQGKVIEDSLVFDMWSWNGVNWKRLAANCPVKEPKATYDPLNKRILVYGDAANKTAANDNGGRAFELWEYKSGTWKKLSTDGPASGSSRIISFDIQRKRLVIPVFEDKKLIVWEWTGKAWKKETCENECPSYRTRFAFAYNLQSKASFLFGGLAEDRTQLGDFWKWDGNRWNKIETNNGPSVRNSAHFVYCTDQLILYGGSIPLEAPAKGTKISNEMWGWKNSWQLIKK